MPRRVYRKRRPKRTRKTYKRSMVKTIARVVRRINPPELKYTCSYYYDNITTSPQIFELVNWPVQGVEGYNSDQNFNDINGAGRIGNQISVKNIQWRFTISPGDNTNFIRVIMFQFMDNSTVTVPIVGDILCNYGNSPWLQPINVLNRQKIKILFDKTYHIQTGGLSTITRTMNIKPPIKSIRFTRDTTAGFPAEIIKGKLYYLLVSDSGTIPHPGWINTTRLCFTDA